jgi:hypothetical protein
MTELVSLQTDIHFQLNHNHTHIHMKKLILLILIFVAFQVKAQQNYWPSAIAPGSTSFSPPFRWITGVTDSLNDFTLAIGTKSYRFYSSARMTQLFAPIIVGRSKADSARLYTSLVPNVWVRQGVAITNAQEPSVLIEGSPQIITGTTVFKIWYTIGFGSTPTIGYAESLTGLPGSWMPYSGGAALPGLPQGAHSKVFKSGSTYYITLTINLGSNIALYSSANGVTGWTVVNSSILALGSAGSFDDTSFGNTSVLVEGSTWRMIYEAKGVEFALGSATSTNGGATWTKNGQILSQFFLGGADLHKIGSVYYLWCHTTKLPSHGRRFRSTDLITWVQDPLNPTIQGITFDEGVGQPLSQVCDLELIEYNGNVYNFYTANPNGSVSYSGGVQIKVAIAKMPFTSLITTNEDGGVMNMGGAIFAYGDNASVGAPPDSYTKFKIKAFGYDANSGVVIQASGSTNIVSYLGQSENGSGQFGLIRKNVGEVIHFDGKAGVPSYVNSGFFGVGQTTAVSGETFGVTGPIYNNASAYSSGGYNLLVQNNTSKLYQIIPSSTFLTTETDPTVPSYSKSLTSFSVIKSSTDALYQPIGSYLTTSNNLSDVANAPTARTNLGLAIGTNILAYRTFGTAANNNTGDFEVPLTFSNGLLRTTNNIAPTYGTAANTFAQGNDSRINNGQTAFGWGNHAGLYLPISTTYAASIAGTTNQITASASTGAITLGLPNIINLGIGSSTSQVTVNGSSSGTNGGANFVALNNNSAIIGIGNKSNLLGGAYDATPTIYAANPINVTQPITVNGSATATSHIKLGATANNYLQAGGADRTPAQVLSDIGAQVAGSYLTGLTGDGNATGPGVAPFTLATVNANPGSWGTGTAVANFTVNAKGLITGAGTTAIQIAESQVTNLVTDLAGKQPLLVSGTNIKTVNGSTLLGSGDIAVSSSTSLLTSFYSDVTSTTSAADAYSYTVAANSLTTNGQYLDCVYTALQTGGAINTIIITFGGQTVYNNSANNLLTGTDPIGFKILRSGTTTARCQIYYLTTSGFVSYSTQDLTGVDFTTTNIIKASISSATAGTLTMKSGTITIYK